MLRTQEFSLKIDLLATSERLEYLRNPSILADRMAHLASREWVLIEEVQKVPELLDEVHALYETKRLNFALSGSSARKLKRVGVNLLAGRAINCRMFPLIYPEYKTAPISIDEYVDWDTLPLTIDNFDLRVETLNSYIDNYLRQELIEEGVIRNIEPFTRFLAVAGQLNGQILNCEMISRESRVKRPTVDKYFQVLFDTLIGFKLPAYQPNLRVNESAHAKFYFFDSGVARAAAGLLSNNLDPSYRGFSFETFMLNEIRAYNEYSRKRLDLFYYAIRSRGDVDLVIQKQKRSKTQPDIIIALEFKLGTSWRSEWAKALYVLNESPKITKVERSIIVYCGKNREQHGHVELWPVLEFLEKLHAGEFF